MRKELHGVILRAAATAVAIAVAACHAEPRAPARTDGIVSLGPNITEALFELGLGDRIVGVTDFCDFPPETASIPKIGGYFNPNFEKIALLQPEAIVLQGNPPEVAELATRNRIRVVSCNMDSLATIDSGIATIGEAFQRQKQAANLRARITRELDAIRKAVQDRPKRTVMIVNTRQDHSLNALFTAGKKSFLSELIEIAGGENIFAGEDSAYFEASKESVVLRNPDVIIEFHAGENLTPQEQKQYIQDWQQLASLNAVKNAEIHLFLESYGLRPGPRVPLIAHRFAMWLHPGLELPAP